MKKKHKYTDKTETPETLGYNIELETKNGFFQHEFFLQLSLACLEILVWENHVEARVQPKNEVKYEKVLIQHLKIITIDLLSSVFIAYHCRDHSPSESYLIRSLESD